MHIVFLNTVKLAVVLFLLLLYMCATTSFRCNQGGAQMLGLDMERINLMTGEKLHWSSTLVLDDRMANAPSAPNPCVTI